METKRYTKETVSQAAKRIQAGELIAFPTETVYGLGADATNAEAVSHVYQAKGRPSDNPLIVHLSTKEQLNQFVAEVPERAIKLIETFWPGPLTMIFEIIPGSLPSVVTGGLKTAAFRMPDHELALALITEAGVPLVGPSANTSGKPSPTTADHVLHDLAGKVTGVLDGGATTVGLESTVLDLSVPEPVILRPGQIVAAEIEAVIGELGQANALPADQQPKAPGMKYQHYSPNARVLMMPVGERDWSEAILKLQTEGVRVAILASEEIISMNQLASVGSFALSEGDNVADASRLLFAGLRQLDESSNEIDTILVQTYPEEGLGLAYMNRLKKAADNQYI